jgi:hypothetical protein
MRNPEKPPPSPLAQQCEPLALKTDVHFFVTQDLITKSPECRDAGSLAEGTVVHERQHFAEQDEPESGFKSATVAVQAKYLGESRRLHKGRRAYQIQEASEVAPVPFFLSHKKPVGFRIFTVSAGISVGQGAAEEVATLLGLTLLENSQRIYDGLALRQRQRGAIIPGNPEQAMPLPMEIVTPLLRRPSLQLVASCTRSFARPRRGGDERKHGSSMLVNVNFAQMNTL